MAESQYLNITIDTIMNTSEDKYNLSTRKWGWLYFEQTWSLLGVQSLEELQQFIIKQLGVWANQTFEQQSPQRSPLRNPEQNTMQLQEKMSTPNQLEQFYSSLQNQFKNGNSMFKDVSIQVDENKKPQTLIKESPNQQNDDIKRIRQGQNALNQLLLPDDHLLFPKNIEENEGNEVKDIDLGQSSALNSLNSLPKKQPQKKVMRYSETCHKQRVNKSFMAKFNRKIEKIHKSIDKIKGIGANLKQLNKEIRMEAEEERKQLIKKIASRQF